MVLQARVLELFSTGSGAFLPVGVFAAQQWENLNTQRADQHEQLVKVLREVQGGLTRAKTIHAVSISIHSHLRKNPKNHNEDNQSCECSCWQFFVYASQKQTRWCWKRLQSLFNRTDFRSFLSHRISNISTLIICNSVYLKHSSVSISLLLCFKNATDHLRYGSFKRLLCFTRMHLKVPSDIFPGHD